MEFRIADIYQDAELLKKVSMTVDELLYRDEKLELDENAALKRYLEEMLQAEKAGNFIDFRSI